MRRVPLLLTAILVLPTAAAILHAGPTSSDPAVVGQWETPFEGGSAAVNMVLLSTGEVLYWSGVEAGDRDNVFFTQGTEHATVRVLDLDAAPGHRVSKPIPVPDDIDLFCSGNTVLPAGDVLVTGATEWTGALVDGTPLWGGHDSLLFDPATENWTRGPDMAVGRWYPSVITTPEGDGLVASGIYNLVDPSTHLELIERYDGTDWSPETSKLLPMYPRIHVVPGGPFKGDLFYQTVGTLWGPFGEHPLEATWNLQKAYDFDTGTWRELGPSLLGARQHGAVVPLMLDPARGHAPQLLTFGGALGRSPVATQAVELADLAFDPPKNILLQPMKEPRWHLNGVLLPDGSVLAIGGGLHDTVYAHGQPNLPVLSVERFDASTGTWSVLAEMEVPRMYHSTAVLLPDGRVLAGGHVPLPVPWKDVRDNVPSQEQIVETRFEIFDPPYLFWDPRPEITSAPASATHGATFTVEVDDTDRLWNVVLVRPGATTHSFDADQRGIILEHTVVDGTTLSVTAPPDATVAPPGHYMLFVNKLDSQGRGKVPSEAAWIEVS